MIHLYLYSQPFDFIRRHSTIDMSRLPSENLADECDKVFQHHKDCVIFLGFLEPGWMLDPKHEARIRRVIRKFETHMVAFHLESIPFSWKNEIDTVYSDPSKNGDSTPINDGGSVQPEPKVED